MKRALCIGINDYPGTGSDLSGCVNDATDWSEELRQRGFETELLLNREAKGDTVVRLLTELVGSAGSQDTVVITFSGHGTWLPDDDGDEADGRDEALCPWDANSHRLITDDELHTIFTGARARARIIFISDSCHSGTVARAAPLLSPEQARRTRFLAPELVLPSEALPAAKRAERLPLRGRSRRSALLLAGCRDAEYSYDATFNGRANGAFTHVALRALRSLPIGSTYRDWHAAITRHLPSQDYPQHPTLSATRAQRGWEVFA
jgi:hypothetical protein